MAEFEPWPTAYSSPWHIQTAAQPRVHLTVARSELCHHASSTPSASGSWALLFSATTAAATSDRRLATVARTGAVTTGTEEVLCYWQLETLT